MNPYQGRRPLSRPPFGFRAPGGQQQLVQPRTPNAFYNSNAPRPRHAQMQMGYENYPHYEGQGQYPRNIRPLMRLQHPMEAFDLTSRVVIPEPKTVVLDPDCICERKVLEVICMACGFIEDSGRIRKRRMCKIHPKCIYNSDLTICPDCESTELNEKLKPQ